MTAVEKRYLLYVITIARMNVAMYIIVPYRHGGGWSSKINAWYLNTLMVYL